MKVIVNDLMQQNYVYERVEPEGKNFSELFEPELTPIQMLEMGVFEGHYMTDCQDEFPRHWFEWAKLSPVPDITCNCFCVKSRQPLSVWQQKGWIIGPDVRGWFQWYCRYYSGRRLPTVDEIQIRRWRSFRRHKAQVEQNCLLMDIKCRAKQRQALLQWAYNPFF
jgi:hypothetical protein